MARVHQLIFSVSLIVLSWYGMMAVHELGHVMGAVLTGATVERVVLYPLALSHTDISQNPQPTIVVWLGPLFGSLAPLAALAAVPRQARVLRNVAAFFAGFCLIANGAYIGIGAFRRIGDCLEMLQHGTPFWVMPVFGAASSSLGLWIWHRLGSLGEFLKHPEHVSWRAASILAGILMLALLAGFLLSPRG